MPGKLCRGTSPLRSQVRPPHPCFHGSELLVKNWISCAGNCFEEELTWGKKTSLSAEGTGAWGSALAFAAGCPRSSAPGRLRTASDGGEAVSLRRRLRPRAAQEVRTPAGPGRHVGVEGVQGAGPRSTSMGSGGGGGHRAPCSPRGGWALQRGAPADALLLFLPHPVSIRVWRPHVWQLRQGGHYQGPPLWMARTLLPSPLPASHRHLRRPSTEPPPIGEPSVSPVRRPLAPASPGAHGGLRGPREVAPHRPRLHPDAPGPVSEALAGPWHAHGDPSKRAISGATRRRTQPVCPNQFPWAGYCKV